jgi:hypothetical protein
MKPIASRRKQDPCHGADEYQAREASTPHRKTRYRRAWLLQQGQNLKLKNGHGPHFLLLILQTMCDAGYKIAKMRLERISQRT